MDLAEVTPRSDYAYGSTSIGKEITRILVTVNYDDADPQPQEVTIFVSNSEFTNRPA